MPPAFTRARNTTTGTITTLPAALVAELEDWVVDEGPAPSRAKPRRRLGRKTESTDTSTAETSASNP